MFDFISPSQPPRARPTFDALAIAFAAPQPYAAENALTRHMVEAVIWASLDLELRNHINLASRRGLEMVSYYADDPDTMAWCASHDGSYLAAMGIPFVRRLVGISHRLEQLVLPMALSGESTAAQRGARTRDELLSRLLSGEIVVSEKEALAIVAGWPAAGKHGAQVPLGAFALFYDLLRLVWLHEWAHALCGHAAIAAGMLGLERLHEFSADRQSTGLVAEIGYPLNEVLQAMEVHADEFATRYCVGQILWGRDPVGMLAGPQINLIERVVIFNLACCVFAVMWSSAEQRYQPGVTFYPPRAPLTSNEPEPLFVTYPTSHPPAALRYMRFRDFQRDLATEFALRNRGAETLAFSIDGQSWGLLDDLAYLDPRFEHLKADTPGLSKTPEVKRLIAYEGRLLEIGNRLTPLLEKSGFVPTSDPSAG